MSDKLDKVLASNHLVSYLSRYSEVLELQLREIQQILQGTVDEIMAAVEEINSRAADGKNKANKILDETYFNPSEETKKAVDSIQASVDALLEGGDLDALAETETDEDIARRTGGIFSKHMEALSEMDQSIANKLVEVMGSLSADDIMAQRISHMHAGIRALQLSLTRILVNFDDLYTPENVLKICNDLLNLTYKTYTTEEERLIFKEVFGANLSDKKAS